MSIITKLENDGQQLDIIITGRFDFSVHQEFRDAYESVANKCLHYNIDLKEVNFLDSSALGMLLLLRDYAGSDAASISISNCSEDVKKILAISNFEKLFEIK